jgi:triacylglycerol lipase
MTRRSTLAVVTLVVALVAPLVPAGGAAADEKLPVPYSFLPAAILAGAKPGANAPGTNDWSCKPTERHPRPVVLVHGLIGNRATNWPTYGPLLKNNGYCVFALTYGVKGLPEPYKFFGGLDRMQSSARELKAFVGKVLRRTGAEEVDIVGHSEGTVVPAYYLKFLGGARYVERFVAIAGAFRGTDPAGLATIYAFGKALGLTPAIVAVLEPVFASGTQLLTGSDFMKNLNRGGSARTPGVSYTNIVTRYDELVNPYTSGTLPRAHNIVVQDVCRLDLSDHFQIVSSPIVAALVLNTLDPAHRRKVPCRLVLPFVGP